MSKFITSIVGAAAIFIAGYGFHRNIVSGKDIILPIAGAFVGLCGIWMAAMQD